MENISLVVAFAGGVLSFVSPCVLPLVPGYLSFISGVTVEELRGRTDAPQLPAEARNQVLLAALLFVFGFSVVFVALGATASVLGQFVNERLSLLEKIAGVVLILFGLHTMGLLRLRWLYAEKRLQTEGRPTTLLGAFVVGLAFAFGWTPCIGPVLGAILTVSAVSTTASSGVALLGVYSLGLGLPFLAAAAFTGGFLTRMPLMRRFGRPLQLLAGGVMVLMGIAMITGYLSAFSYWLLETFPGLASIG